MQVTINGEPTQLAEDATVADLVAERSDGHGRVAVARNGDVVPRSTWTTTRLTAGDSLEVLAPTAGG
ncbi:sulfur carrier protein ThiS [Geodermatophilus ruber]|uniref:Sulfur carrier protein n=1 Tax=Geodermatophilus ruber TaxID=504800 RepID=A0A1I4KPF8_9ACTN|nr:sulfur carrier protein ThiS [Geodermatophilus ruber]SFL80662.1 sulfur carrier protein [Geodermatophilus ruber]